MSDETTKIDLSQIADKALQKNIANILRKLSEGKTLSAREHKMFEAHTKKQTDADLARVHHCDERTIRNWRKEGAPLHDPETMKGWLASRKNVPPNTGVSVDGAPVPINIIPLELTTEEGAVSALRRLAEAEVNAAKNYQEAVKSGNPLLVKNALASWMELTDTLRKYDSQISSSRRDSGEVLPRAEVEAVLKALGYYLRMSGQLAIEAACETTEPIWRIKEPCEMNILLRRLFWETLLNSFAGLAAHPDGPALNVPAWAVQALSDDMKFVMKDAPEVVKKRSEAIRILVRHNAKASGKKAISQKK